MWASLVSIVGLVALSPLYSSCSANHESETMETVTTTDVGAGDLLPDRARGDGPASLDIQVPLPDVPDSITGDVFETLDGVPDVPAVELGPDLVFLDAEVEVLEDVLIVEDALDIAGDVTVDSEGELTADVLVPVYEPCGPPGGNGNDEVPMCDVPGGPFPMGLAPDDCAVMQEFTPDDVCNVYTGSETPLHSVVLSPYQIDQVEITVLRYRQCELAGACTQPAMLPPGAQDDTPGQRGWGEGTVTGTLSSSLTNDQLAGAKKYVIVAPSLPPDPGEAIFKMVSGNLPTPYTVSNVPEGEYLVLAFMDLAPYKMGAGPGPEDYVGMFNGNSPELVVIVGDSTAEGIDVVADTPFEQAPWGKGCTYGEPDNDQLPVNCATWHQLKEYCEWTGKRLCTEAEFEKAAKGEEHRIWPWGNEWAEGMGNAYEVISDGYFWVSPVGAFPQGASPYGCLDMDANVMEWVLDWYDKDWYVKTPSEDPMGPCAGAEPCLGFNERVLKGTSWRAQVGSGYGIAFDSRNSSRIPYPPVDPQLDDVGARCCESL